jgi:HJR/Mrr/RecB family endonuclease
MGLFDFLKGRKGAARGNQALAQQWTPAGVELKFAKRLEAPDLDSFLGLVDRSSAEETILAAFVGQLISEERCSLESDRVVLPWAELYRMISDREQSASVSILRPPSTGELRPILACVDTLADQGFDVTVDGWAQGNKEISLESLVGPIAVHEGREELLPEAAWRAIAEVARFSARPLADRNQHHNELGWGAIRAFADDAGAVYRTPYLETTFVLTPKTLRMPLKRDDTPFGRVLTVEPTFDGAPDGWLRAFDKHYAVQPHYDVTPPGGGHVRVVISEPVRRVLEVVKREMPARRVAGSKAERFVHNPWSFLGDAAVEVLREEDFAADKAGAGALATVFSVVARTRDGHLDSVDLVVTEHFHGGAARTNTRPFKSPVELEAFCNELERALGDERAVLPWEEHDLTLDGDSTVQLEYTRQVLHLWRAQPAERISLEDVYELVGYSDRIEGIGEAKPIYVPLLQKPPTNEEGDSGWLPSDLTPMVKITLAGHEGQVVIPLGQQWVDEFEKQVATAEASGAAEVRNSSLPTAVATAEARTLVNGFRSMLDAQAKVKRDEGAKPQEPRPPKQTLLVKLNFAGVDYLEERRANLALPEDAQAVLPTALRPSIKLKKHQLNGVAWFQHLVVHAPRDCRGALLADDMGLGKTLQLLTVLAWFYEVNKHAPPSLILAPKSLLENWEAETRKFFSDSFPEVLVLYGDALAQRKQPFGLIAQELHDRGVTELLRPGWAGPSKLIITSYEVLTRYEFSLARQPLAFLICDEAQRIKTPGTQATIAAKALKADFRIACTGTPVENTLADLWCLFDLVQPGLLGGLEEFGKTYRRPIECETEEQKGALQRLQDVIAPQTLRRTKLDIAGDLKKKFFAYGAVTGGAMQFKEALTRAERLEVSISDHQNLLYLGGLKKLHDAAKESDGRKRAQLSFGALHLMKAVCAEPYCLPGMKFLPDKGGVGPHLRNSPKLAWLLSHLREVQRAGEKAIVFTELREVQAALFYFLRESFSLKPSIINGDSQNRQSYIDRFSDSSGFNVIILSTLAAGAGLNVTAANHVFHFTRAWNPAKENQATDRAYRIGQEKDVYVYCPLLVSPQFVTFDVRLDELLRRKAGLADATIGGSGMESMLNGTGRDVSFVDLVGEGAEGVEAERRLMTMDDVDRLDGFRFEVLCKLLWSKQGYLAELTPKRGGDGGIDVVALRGSEGQLLQCKSSVGREVGWDAVKEVTAGAARYQARFTNTLFQRLVVTNQRFTRGARSQAEENRVVVVERPELEVLLGRHPVYLAELDDEAGACLGTFSAAA